MAEMITEKTITIGDYSGDGHGMASKFMVRMSGDDVSDEALKTSYAAAVKSAGFGLYDVFNEYNVPRISKEKWASMRDVWSKGLNTYVGSGDVQSEIGFVKWDVGDEFEIEIDAVELVMAFVGYTIPNFRWEMIPFPPN